MKNHFSKGKKIKSQSKLWMSYAGFVKSGNPKSSQQIDELIYGQKEIEGYRKKTVKRDEFEDLIKAQKWPSYSKNPRP